MKAKELRQKYLEFFKTKGHAIIPSASLIPENDPTVLFTTAGMHPLVPYLMGEKHPEGTRLVDAQKSIRTTDIEEVGDTTHHTFFEMMGNWSLGDYFKKESLEWSWEFLTSSKWLGLDPKRFAVSVFQGDEVAPFDEEAYGIWQEIFAKEGIPEARIAKLDKKANWWGPAGETGPCGPDSEIFYWVGPENEIPQSFNDDNDLWVEVWNNVFMEFNKNAQGQFEKLVQQNVDTGLGLERVTAVMQGLDDNYKTELWTNLIAKIEELSGKKYEESVDITKAIRVVADHIKASTFIMGDDKGMTPSNTDQGYIVRRLIRRAIRYGKQLEITQELWLKEVAQVVIEDYKDIYSELERNQDFILDQLDKEETQFSKTLEKGLKKVEDLFKKKYRPLNSVISEQEIGKDLFNLFQEQGLPMEMSLEEIKKLNVFYKANLSYNKDIVLLESNKAMKEHQEKSRTAAAGKFASGLADHSEETTRLHTAAHLLLAALQKVLGPEVIQKGSNITPERIRFDFAWDEKLTDEQKTKVEKLVNEAIEKKIPVECNEMTVDEAKVQGAHGIFDDKYGSKVKVYKMGDFSHEICSGPHVENTGELGHFKIKKEESSSAGVRRIKATLE
ncbi:MAG: alanine--tRNA ligase [Patescibacteria group bacterium]